MSSANPGPGDGRQRPPAMGRLATTPPPVPSTPTPASIPSAQTVPSSTRKPPPPVPPSSDTTAKRSTLPVVLVCGAVTVLAIAGAAYFALESFKAKDQLDEANRKSAKALSDYEEAAGASLKQREEELTQARAEWATKEKDLTARLTEAERSRGNVDASLKAEADRAKTAQTQAESRLATAQSQLTAANLEINRLRSATSASNARTDDMLRSSSSDIRTWVTKQFSTLPMLNSQHEIRVAMRKHEMSKLLEAERKKTEKLVYQGSGTLELGNSESGLAYRAAILRYATISAPMPASVVDVKLVYRWNVPESATSLDPGDDNEIISYSGVTGGSPDGSKDLRFDYRKTDDRFRTFDAMSPVIYKGERTRMVFCLQFKEKGDPNFRWLVFKANTLERAK